MRIELVIFDCDGVIADSELLSADVMIAQLAEMGLSIGPEDIRRDFLGRSFPTVAKVIRERFNRELPADFEAEYRRRLLLRFVEELAPTPGFPEMLNGLRHPCCVATSSSRPRVERTLQLLGLSDFFGPRVFTASQVAHGKPAPDLFLFAAEQMGVDPTATLVIEDSLPGIEAARAAGMRVLAYRGASHLRGHPAMTPADVPSFDNWNVFPHLLKQIETLGEIR
ncbi:HAD family hydrolase [Paracoccus methylarcula]|nr:HAD family hydrolase [Paracoccus methylarcula]